MSVSTDNELLILYLLEKAVLKEELDDAQKNSVIKNLISKGTE